MKKLLFLFFALLFSGMMVYSLGPPENGVLQGKQIIYADIQDQPIVAAAEVSTSMGTAIESAGMDALSAITSGALAFIAAACFLLAFAPYLSTFRQWFRETSLMKMVRNMVPERYDKSAPLRMK